MEYGEQRMIDILLSKHHTTLPRIINKLFTDIKDYTGLSAPLDDQTLLLVKYTMTGESA